MKIKFIQVNIYCGKYLDSLVEFLKREQPDFISMQEVTVGSINLYSDKEVSTFEILKERLGLDGVLSPYIKYLDLPGASFGNAVLGKFPIKQFKTIPLNQSREIMYSEVENATGEENAEINESRQNLPRELLDVTFDVNGRNIHALSWHGAWTAPPTDTVETVRQASVLAQYLKTIPEPYILGCDSNNVPKSKTILTIDAVSNNLMKGSGILQTTHPTAHKIAPRGYLIDFVFTSPDFKLKSVNVPDVLVSDHLPVVCELEL